MARDLGKFLVSGNYSDVTLVAGEPEIRAHRAILAARSQVFDAMFSIDMAEKATGHVVIDDVDGEVVHQMLGYIYTMFRAWTRWPLCS